MSNSKKTAIENTAHGMLPGSARHWAHRSTSINRNLGDSETP